VSGVFIGYIAGFTGGVCMTMAFLAFREWRRLTRG